MSYSQVRVFAGAAGWCVSAQQHDGDDGGTVTVWSFDTEAEAVAYADSLNSQEAD